MTRCTKREDCGDGYTCRTLEQVCVPTGRPCSDGCKTIGNVTIGMIEGNCAGNTCEYLTEPMYIS